MNDKRQCGTWQGRAVPPAKNDGPASRIGRDYPIDATDPHSRTASTDQAADRANMLYGQERVARK